MRKETSTNTLNKNRLEESCGLAYTISVLGGRWKISILAYLLEEGHMRFSDLKNKLEGISERMLTTQLKELVSDGLIERTVYPEVPPRVEYYLSGKGKTLEVLLREMSLWGEKQR